MVSIGIISPVPIQANKLDAPIKISISRVPLDRKRTKAIDNCGEGVQIQAGVSMPKISAVNPVDRPFFRRTALSGGIDHFFFPLSYSRWLFLTVTVAASVSLLISRTLRWVKTRC